MITVFRLDFFVVSKINREAAVVVFFYLNKIFFTVSCSVYPSPDDKILALSKMKAFADDKWNVSQNIKFIISRAENIVGKVEYAVYQHFLFFSTMFS